MIPTKACDHPDPYNEPSDTSTRPIQPTTPTADHDRLDPDLLAPIGSQVLQRNDRITHPIELTTLHTYPGLHWFVSPSSCWIK